jgi:hypothetical protein
VTELAFAGFFAPARRKTGKRQSTTLPQAKAVVCVRLQS